MDVASSFARMDIWLGAGADKSLRQPTATSQAAAVVDCIPSRVPSAGNGGPSTVVVGCCSSGDVRESMSQITADQPGRGRGGVRMETVTAEESDKIKQELAVLRLVLEKLMPLSEKQRAWVLLSAVDYFGSEEQETK